jgi:phosphoglycolate phosphatase-like HAD superfamily hydrolase
MSIFSFWAFPRLQLLVSVLGALLLASICSVANAADPLASWNDGPAKKSILEFVAAVTDEKGKDYVAPDERIATFDNDGTLWVESPMYTQVLFAFDRVKELAPQHPEWKTTQPFKALLEGDMKTVGASGMKGLMEILMATHSGMTAAEFEQEVSDWLATTKQKKFNRLYTELIYQPQLELLDYLRANGFKTFIVSGGGMAFMRPNSERLYGIPPEQVVGSSIVAEFQLKDGKPEMVRTPKIDFINDKAGKPVGIYQHIGRRPILAFGNSDSDMQMIEYTLAGEGRRLGLFVHHTDAEREYAYDRKSHVGTLDKALDQAGAKGWIIVDMKKDWKTVFPGKSK